MKSQTLEEFAQEWATDPLEDDYLDKGGLLTTIADAIGEEVSINFETESTADGTPWADRKGEEFYDHPKLDDTGAMKDAAAENFRDEGENIVSVGCLADEPFYAKYHQEGTRNMPARPFENISDEGTAIEDIERGVADIAERFVAGQWK